VRPPTHLDTQPAALTVLCLSVHVWVKTQTNSPEKKLPKADRSTRPDWWQREITDARIANANGT